MRTTVRAHADQVALVLAGLTLLGLLASVTANQQLAAGNSVSERNAVTEAWYVWTVWTNLVLLATLGTWLAFLAVVTAPAQRGTSSPAWRWLNGCHSGRAWWLGLIAVASAAGALAGWDMAVGVLLLFPLAVQGGARLAGIAPPGPFGMFSVAFLLRASLAVALTEYGLITRAQVQVWDDEVAYDHAATNLAMVLAAGWGSLEFEWRHLESSYLDLFGLVSWLLGWTANPFSTMRLLNALFGTLQVGLVYAIGRALWRGRLAPLVAACVVAVWPMGMVWSASGLREALSDVTVLIIPWLLMRAEALRTWPLRVAGGLTALLALIVLEGLRPESALAVSVAAAIALVVRSWQRLPRLTVLLSGLGVLVLGALLMGDAAGTLLRNNVSPRAIEYRLAAAELTPLIERDASRVPPRPDPSFLPLGVVVRVRGADGAITTGITAGYDYALPGYDVRFADETDLVLPAAEVPPLTDENVGWLDVLKRGVNGARMLVLPRLPGNGEPLKRLAISPDTTAWDALFVGMLVSAIVFRARLGARGLTIALFPLLMVIGLAASSSNLGTLARHRTALVPWLALIAAPLIASRFRVGTGVDGSEPEPLVSVKGVSS